MKIDKIEKFLDIVKTMNVSLVIPYKYLDRECTQFYRYDKEIDRYVVTEETVSNKTFCKCGTFNVSKDHICGDDCCRYCTEEQLIKKLENYFASEVWITL